MQSTKDTFDTDDDQVATTLLDPAKEEPTSRGLNIVAINTRFDIIGGHQAIVRGSPEAIRAVTPGIAAHMHANSLPPDSKQLSPTVEAFTRARSFTFDGCEINGVRGNQYDFTVILHEKKQPSIESFADDCSRVSSPTEQGGGLYLNTIVREVGGNQYMWIADS